MLPISQIQKNISNKTSLKADRSSLLDAISDPDSPSRFLATSNSDPSKNRYYYYIIMNQFDFYRNEAIEEIFREKNLKGASLDSREKMWVLNSPSFIKELDLLNDIKRTVFFNLNQEKIVDNYIHNVDGKIEQVYYFASVVSTNQKAIQNLMLRIGSFQSINYLLDEEGEKVRRNTKSDGVFGYFNTNPRHPDPNYCYTDPTLGFDLKRLHSSVLGNSPLPLIRRDYIPQLN